MLSCEIPKKFYHFCVEFKPFFFAEKVRYLRYDNVGNKLDMVQFYLKHCDPLNFVQSENVNRIVEVMRRKKENEQVYYDIKYIFSDQILFFMYNLNNLVKSLSANEHIFKQIHSEIEKFRSTFIALKMRENLPILKTHLKDVTDVTKDIKARY